ncbi:hypothetical protein [Candidatus Mycoplasma haematominutum]|uniref:Uncharacterized protein n=1 Tax=Candidatus Mycoplasma haematominutum 'Birmingham 1' TaxID=1116213 RepID=G8C358_9MOLU|nr:hypothetical protein [Candidatus Mycoplasma haematominutum]CCE66756.1 hypothetical protein (homolog to MSU_0467) [Candidatus Mycoplasma haematominutum 'Birmingham 1']
MEDNQNEKITIKLQVSKDLYERLQRQLELLKANNIMPLQEANTVEDLIMFLLEHCTIGDENIKKIEERMQTVLETLKDEGVDILDLFNTFHRKFHETKEPEEREEKKKLTLPEKKKS